MPSREWARFTLPDASDRTIDRMARALQLLMATGITADGERFADILKAHEKRRGRLNVAALERYAEALAAREEPWNVKHFACSHIYQGPLLAHLLEVSRSTVARMAKDGRLPRRNFDIGGPASGWSGTALNNWLENTGRLLVERDGEYRIILADEAAPA